MSGTMTRPRRGPRNAWLGALCTAFCGAVLAAAAPQDAAPQAPPPSPQAGEAPEPPALEDLLRRPLTQPPRNVRVSSPSRVAQGADEAPTPTHVVTAQQIRRAGHRSLVEVLRSLPGLFITDNGKFAFVGARGVGRPFDFNTRLLFLVDGMRLNDNVYEAALIGESFPIDLALIERVEFSPGPGSALYGSNAFFGVVNIVTQRADRLRGPRLEAELGSDRTRRLRGAWGTRDDDGHEWLAALSLFEQDRIPVEQVGWLQSHPDIDVARLERLNADRSSRWLLRHAQPGRELTLGGLWRERLTPAVSGPLGEPSYSRASDLDRLNFAALRQSVALHPDWDLSLQAALQDMHYDFRVPLQDEVGTTREIGEIAEGRWLGADLRLQTQRWAGHQTTFGWELQNDLRQRLGRDGEIRDRGRGRRYALYLQDEWRLAPGWQLSLGLRHERLSLGTRRTEPRLGVIWTASPRTTWRLLHGSAFRAPNFSERAGNGQIGAPQPDPERLRGTELSWEHAPHPAARLQITVFDARVAGLITRTLPDLRSVNLPTFRLQGGEIDAEWRGRGGWTAAASLTTQRAVLPGGAGLANSPDWVAKGRAGLPLAGGRSLLHWEWQGTGPRQVPAGAVGIHLLHNLSWEVLSGPARGLRIGIHNLRDRRHVERVPEGDLLRPGRSVTVSWRVGGSP